MSDALPKKLTNDAILEAALEIRFEPVSSMVAEVFFGRFTDEDNWKGFSQVRLPSADLPAAMKRMDPNLRFLPSLELTSPEGGISVRIGPESVIYSRRGVYPGWKQFFNEIDVVVSRLYRMSEGAKVRRIGLRYINALRSDIHGINGIKDIALDVCVADNRLTENLNLNFKHTDDTDFETMARIASIDLASGPIPANATVIVDIDVYTLQNYVGTDPESVKKAIVAAHELEKKTFFNILGYANTERLREV